MAPFPVALDDTLGAAFIGNVLAACLYGLTALQTYIYYNRSGNDSVVLKSLIALLWVLDTLHLILISHTVYWYAVTNFGSVITLLVPTWSVLVHIIVTGVSDGIVRGIFCHRIWILSEKNVWICTSITISSLVAFGGSLAYPIKGFEYYSYVKLNNVSWLLYFSLATACVTDAIITATLCVLLARRRSVFKRVNLTVRTLILYTVNTGALTTLCTLMCLLAYAISPHTFVYISFYFLLPKLLLNSLLATLNARRSLREQMAGSMALPLSSTSTYGGRTAARVDRANYAADSAVIDIKSGAHSMPDAYFPGR